MVTKGERDAGNNAQFEAAEAFFLSRGCAVVETSHRPDAFGNRHADLKDGDVMWRIVKERGQMWIDVQFRGGPWLAADHVLKLLGYEPGPLTASNDHLATWCALLGENYDAVIACVKDPATKPPPGFSF